MAEVSERRQCFICDKWILKHKCFQHFRSTHASDNHCPFCQKDFSDSTSLTDHLKDLHGHLLGFFVVEDEEREEIKVTRVVLKEEMHRLQIPKGNGTLLELNSYLTCYDFKKGRPLWTLEVLTPTSLKVNYEDKSPNQFKMDGKLKGNGINLDAVSHLGMDVAHLSTRANHRSSKADWESTFLQRNLILLEINSNRGMLSSVDHHVWQVASCWKKTTLLTIPVYRERKETIHVEGIDVVFEIPDEVVKVAIFGDHQAQVYVVPNTSAFSSDKVRNFTACRGTLEEVRQITSIHLYFQYPLSWELPGMEWKIWKCRRCLDCFAEADDLFLHERFYHDTKSCPVHRKVHDDIATFDQFLAHVRAHPKRKCHVEECHSEFWSAKLLWIHKNDVHGEKIHMCTHEGCTKSFTTNYRLSQHKKIHDPNRKYLKCTFPDCDKKYFNEENLFKHTNRHHYKMEPSSQRIMHKVQNIKRRKLTRDEPNLTVNSMKARIVELETLNLQLVTRNAALEALNSQLVTRNAELLARNTQLETRNTELVQKGSRSQLQRTQKPSRKRKIIPEIVKPNVLKRRPLPA